MPIKIPVTGIITMKKYNDLCISYDVIICHFGPGTKGGIYDLLALVIINLGMIGKAINSPKLLCIFIQ